MSSQLARALEQEEQLRLQRRRARVAIEALEKRILVGLLEHQLAAEAARETPRETRLADADRTFDDDETMRGSGDFVCHVLVERFRDESFEKREAGGPRARRQRRRPVPAPGTSSSGAISRKGYRTKLRSGRPGCGTVRSGSVDPHVAEHAADRDRCAADPSARPAARARARLRCASARAAARAARAASAIPPRH